MKHALVAVVFLLGAALACGGSKPMTESEAHVTLQVAGRSLRVTRRDGEQMRAALIAALSRSPDPALQAEGTRVGNGDVSLGSDNDLRISSWLLDVRDGQPVLVRREQASAVGFLNRIARLSGTPGGPWTVTALDEELVHAR